MNRQPMIFDRFPSLESSPLRLALFSCGLGNINRGFEISTARFYRALQSDPELDVRLYCGGSFDDALKVWNVGRNDWLRSGVRWSPLMNDMQRWKLAYVLEQVSFSFGLLARSGNWQPDVVWTKEVPLAHILYHFRQLTGLKYKIIFSNGGGFKPSTYAQFDFLHHLQPDAYAESLEFGIPAEKMTVIPNLVPQRSVKQTREDLRQAYGFAPSDWIVVCVAAWNTHHKRIDYLIEETARMAQSDEQVKLILCGQPEPEGEELKKLAEQLMPGRVHWLTLPEERVAEVLKLSDVFVLPSLYEALGAVIIEAAMSGLPVICHPHAGSKFILQDSFWLPDLSNQGALEKRLREFRQNMPSESRLQGLKESVCTRFAESRIAAEFKEMVFKVHTGFAADATLPA